MSKMDWMTENELISHIKRKTEHEHKCFLALATRYDKHSRRMLNKITSGRYSHIHEDILNTTWATVWTRLESHNVENFGPWLMAVIRTTAIDMIRTERSCVKCVQKVAEQCREQATPQTGSLEHYRYILTPEQFQILTDHFESGVRLTDMARSRGQSKSKFYKSIWLPMLDKIRSYVMSVA